MSPEYKGSFAGDGHRFAIVVARFNELVTSKLLSGAMDALVRHGVRASDIDVAWTPGAFEIPLIAKRLAQTGKYAGVICLGAVIRGETPHFDYVASNAAGGIASVSLQTDVPMGFGILTTEDLDQALARAGSKAGNKGFDAAVTVLEMANLLKALSSED